MNDANHIKQLLRERVEELAAYLFPNGKRDGNHWCVGDVTGAPGKSFKICIAGEKAGLWGDFAESGKHSRSLLDLWMHARNVDFKTALREVAQWLGQPLNGHDNGGSIFPTLDEAIANMEQRLAMCITRRDSYHDREGNEHFVVARFDGVNGKQFRPFHRNSSGWIAKDPPGKLPLFRLPELIARPGERVFHVEGEKCASELATLGSLVTTSAHGAKSAHKSDWQSLAGREVVILPDNDAEGRAYAQTVAQILSLLSPPAAVQIVELPGLPQKGDCVDWLERRDAQTPEDIVEELLAITSAKEIQPASVANEPTTWGEPKPLPADLPDVPAFNFDYLPDTLRAWNADIAERMQCPADFPAVGAMVVLGSLVGRKIGIRPKRHDDWLVIPNLWGGIVGRPGLLKSPALEQALIPLRRLVAGAFEKHEAAMREHGINDMLKMQRKKLAENKIGKHLKQGNEEAARAEAEAVVCDDEAEPVCRRYEINDSTIEKLGVLLAENPTGLLLFRDELSGLLRALDREDRAGDRAKFLEMWAGTGELTYDRIERGTVRIPSNTLSILGGIQPDLLMGYVREAVRGGEGADGLIQRFQLFVWPDVSKEWRNVDRWPDTNAKNEAFAVFKYLDELQPEAAGADTSDGIPFLRFASDAQERFDHWRESLEIKLRSGDEHPAFEAHLAKYRKLVPALALLIHLANRDTGAVSLAALDKALLWAAHLEAHARRIYSAVLRPDTAAARELAKHLQRGDLPERFTLRETYRHGWAGLSAKEDAEAATEILCELEWIRAVAEIGRTPGRPASPTFEINPKILKLSTERTDRTDKTNSGSFVSGVQGVVGNNSSDSASRRRLSVRSFP